MCEMWYDMVMHPWAWARKGVYFSFEVYPSSIYDVYYDFKACYELE